MSPFHGIRDVPPMRALGWRGDVSVWGIDTAFSRLYDRAVEKKAMFKEPAVGIRHEGLGLPDPFKSDFEILFPIVEGFRETEEAFAVRALPAVKVAVFVHRGPYEQISRTYEKVLDWFRENRYEVAGAPREVFLVAPEPHGGGTQDDMLTEIQVPIRKAS